jgi:type II secretory pathway pseudopilin PulG
MFVLILIGILAAILIPTVGGTSSAHRVIEQARAIHSAMAEARARAITEQRDYRFELTSGNVYALQFDDGGTWTTYGSAHDLSEGVTATIGGSASGTIVFLSQGRVDEPEAVVVESSGHEQTIDVMASGMARWEGGGP